MFILIDYFFFKLSRGKYSIKSKRKRHPINLSWEGKYEPVLEEILNSGDVVFFSNRRSSLSWLVQYFTKTDISHVGLYTGNGKVLHATLDGSKIDHLRIFFEAGYDIIPVSMHDAKKGGKTDGIDVSSFVGINYPLSNVILRGCYYLFGVPWRKFRMTYIFDVLLIFALCSYLLAGQYYNIAFAVMSSIYVLLVLTSYLYRNKVNIPTTDPGEGFYCLAKIANVIPSVKKMNEDWFLAELTKAAKKGKASMTTLL